jgi:hypothetical protein
MRFPFLEIRGCFRPGMRNVSSVISRRLGIDMSAEDYCRELAI